MGIVSDINESKALWKKASFPYKVFISISLFISISSFASLSDEFVKWAGFILDGVNFYRSYIAYPISELSTSIGLNIGPTMVDFLVVYSFLGGSFIRGAWAAYKAREIALIGFILSSMVFAVFFIVLVYQSHVNSLEATYIHMLIIVFTFMLMWWMESKRNFKIVTMTSIIVVSFIILVLGAINSVIKLM